MKAYILSLNKEADLTKQWDFGLLKDFLEGNLWKPTNWQDFDIKSVKTLKKSDRALVAIPARHHAGLEQQVDKELAKIDRVVLFLMGDEEADFNITKIKHKNIEIWVQNPHMGKHDSYHKIGTGYPQHIHKNLPKEYEKNMEVFFAGQNTHNRREELIEALKDAHIDKLKFVETSGFTQGESHKEYYQDMVNAICTPAPSGAVIPDSFRLFESLECMSIPIADNKTPNGEIWSYWDWLFGVICPFPTISKWYALEEIFSEIKGDYEERIIKQTAWWIKWKRDFAYKVMEQLNA